MVVMDCVLLRLLLRCSPLTRWGVSLVGQGFILVFSITNDSSFVDLKKIHDSILAVHPLGDNVRCVLGLVNELLVGGCV